MNIYSTYYEIESLSNQFQYIKKQTKGTMNSLDFCGFQEIDKKTMPMRNQNLKRDQVCDLEKKVTKYFIVTPMVR